MLCNAPGRWHKWKREKNSLQLAVKFSDVEQRNLILLDPSSLSRCAPPPLSRYFLLPFRFTSEATYAVFSGCVYTCMLLVSMLHEDAENWFPLTRSCLCLFSRVFRRLRWCFIRLCVFFFGANIWVSKRLVHSLLIARKLIASISVEPSSWDWKVILKSFWDDSQYYWKLNRKYCPTV